MIQTIKSVAVVGAGISGVVSAKHLKAAGLNVTVFERSAGPGGVWVYDERQPLEPTYPSPRPILGETSKDGDQSGRLQNNDPLLHAPPGPCYDGLTNNVTTPLIELKGQPWDDGTGDFVNHRVIRNYIQNAADNIGMATFTNFNTRVLHMSKVGQKWQVLSVTSRPSLQGKMDYTEHVHEFDAVVIASGHYHECNVPDIIGLSAWKHAWPDRVEHSKRYRRPDSFRNQNILLVGAGASSFDIARETGPVAGTIYQVFRSARFDPPAGWLPSNAVRIGTKIRSFDSVADEMNGGLLHKTALEPTQAIPGTVTLEDGTVLQDIHRVIMCTGYHFSFPFLPFLHRDNLSAKQADESCIVTDGTQAHNLHKDIFYIPDPTLAFIGVPFYTATFTLFEFQAIALAAVFGGMAKLPSGDLMRTEYNEKTMKKGYGRDFHSLRDKEVEYVDDLLMWVNRDGALIGAKPIDGHSSKWRLERAVMWDKVSKHFLTRSDKSQHELGEAKGAKMPQNGDANGT